MDFIAERAKAFAAAAITGVVQALIVAVETTFKFDIPITYEAMILSAIAGLIVYQVPNKPVTK